MNRIFLVLMLAACDPPPPPPPAQTELGHVEELIFLPRQHGTSTGIDLANFRPVVGTVDIPATYGVVFGCEHGRFAVQGQEDRHEALWKRFAKGDRVRITYRVECNGKMDFLDAERLGGGK